MRKEVQLAFFLLPESLDPSSLTLVFLSQPLYSFSAPPNCVSFLVLPMAL